MQQVSDKGSFLFETNNFFKSHIRSCFQSYIIILIILGGTIDVTLYEVQNDSELKELSEPSGGPWGGTFVDQEYESFLKDLFGKDVWETYIKQCPEDFLDIKRKFEAKKRGIKESQKPKTTIQYPQSLYQTYCNCKIRKSLSRRPKEISSLQNCDCYERKAPI